MPNIIKKVLANVVQTFTEPEKSTARSNIGAIAKSDLPNGMLSFDSVADINSSAIQVWGGDSTSSMGTYKSIGNISVPAGHIADVTIAGSLQHSSQNNATNTIVFQLSEQDSLDNDAIAQPVYVRGKGAPEEISLSVRFIIRNTSSITKTYYFGAYNLSSVPSGDIIELANNLTSTQGLRITLISYGVNSNT
jgi:hypothetical protein